ncbi:hypothetical protein IFM89_037488 [Coptis chinensis]|uniref:Uncharacterized protein n=1 Tax=Coptis chinensis TaxID=261450 RepID=A0A835I5K9_9MAGN|nr:hypothetical protein IFM89_037488 [Coptis chinensis]
MAEKISTLVLKVDLNCTKCYNKMRKTLCQYHYEIYSQTIDKKHGTITITGHFDPQTFSKKLNSNGGKVIKGIEIKQNAKKEEEKPKPKQADAKPDKPKQADAKSDKPQEIKAAEKPKKAEEAKSDPPKQAAPAAKPSEPGPPMKLVEPGPVLAYPPWVQPYGAYSVPCYEGYVGGPVYDGYGHAYGRQPCYDNYGGNNRVNGGGGGYLPKLS